MRFTVLYLVFGSAVVLGKEFLTEEELEYFEPALFTKEYPPAPLGPDGRVIDTDEVEQAKADHFANFHAIAQQHKHHISVPPQDTPEVAHAKAAHIAAFKAIAKKNSVAPKLTHNGIYLRDTPAVAKARAAHLAVHQNGVYSQWVPDIYGHWAPAGYYQDGQYLQDTPAVARARSRHLATHAKANEASKVNSGYGSAYPYYAY